VVRLSDSVRRACAEVATAARSVEIEVDALDRIEPGPEPALDPERHYLEGSPEEVTMYMLVLDSVNFGSGWFPTLRKRPGCSGYFTVAWALADWFRAHGPPPLPPPDLPRMLGQDPGHPLMRLYERALRDLGLWLGGDTALAAVARAGGSADALASLLARGMPFFDDRGFYKRAQIVPNDLALAGVASFHDLDGLTIFADNLVPHVLRVDGVLRYEAGLAARIDAGELLPPGREEREIRACAVHACELIAAKSGVPPRKLDTWLWKRGQEPRYKALPRHRTRTVFY
jgi:hypothetical protein